MSEVIIQVGGFCNNSSYYGDTDSKFIQKKYWYSLVDNGYLGKSLGLGKSDYSNSGNSFAWFPAPKIKCCPVIDIFSVITAKRSFEGYRKEYRTIELNELISLLGGKTLSGRVSIDWTKSFESIKIPHRKQGCLECKKGNYL